MLKNRHVLSVVLIAVTVLSAGCGYRVHRHSLLSFNEVSIGRIENKTVEPKLQDRLHRKLTGEFLKQGVAVSPSADRELTCVINEFLLTGFSEKQGIIIEYRVIIDAEFTLADGAGNVLTVMKITTPFIVSLTGSGNLQGLLAAKEIAEERALEDIAMRVVLATLMQ